VGLMQSRLLDWMERWNNTSRMWTLDCNAATSRTTRAPSSSSLNAMPLPSGLALADLQRRGCAEPSRVPADGNDGLRLDGALRRPRSVLWKRGPGEQARRIPLHGQQLVVFIALLSRY
jgi:hypothetical protein